MEAAVRKVELTGRRTRRTVCQASPGSRYVFIVLCSVTMLGLCGQSMCSLCAMPIYCMRKFVCSCMRLYVSCVYILVRADCIFMYVENACVLHIHACLQKCIMRVGKLVL
jgi:hypothetical protein